MNVVDSSGWLEYFANGQNADFFAPAIEDTAQLLVPVICVYEVFKRILQQQGLGQAETRIADLYKGNLIDVTSPLAISAAVLSAQLKLPMADSLILATARANNATLWTQDEHFANIEGVKYVPARSRPGNS
jgi:toxin FitB